MKRTERLLLAGHAHHVMRKTTGFRPMFRENADYLHCLGQIRALQQEYEVEVHAWCLLPDRLHMLISPGADAKVLSSFMKALSCRATLHNKRRHHQAARWESRFRASPVEPGHWLLACMSYIERLPIEFGLARSAFHYALSSYRMRLGKTDSYWVHDPEDYLRLGDSLDERAKAFSHYLRSGLDEKETAFITNALARNDLTGSPRFAETIKRELNIEVPVRRPRGRPRKHLKSQNTKSVENDNIDERRNHHVW